MMVLVARMGAEERRTDSSLGLEVGEESHELLWACFSAYMCVHLDTKLLADTIFYFYRKVNNRFIL